jgi:ABC-type multidrug transport system fused ATPase/permease subunit
MNGLSIKLRQRQADTEHFDLTELMGSLDSRSSFAATRLTGREKVQQEKFAVVMGRWQRNQLKIRSVDQLMRPMINMMRTFSQMSGYYFGGFMVANGTLTPADLGKKSRLFLRLCHLIVKPIRRSTKTGSGKT